MGLLGILFQIIHAILGLYIVVLIIHVVISWLYAFDVVSRSNAFVYSVWRFTTALTDPVLKPLRRLIPPIAGVDLSVLVLVLGLAIFRDSVLWWLYGVITGRGPIL
ncbi:MAG TPA: YggT family protein [Terricaulis sp.]|nr:YggT family protein [Terricaulis sp.]